MNLRPQTTVILAMSADGKITDYQSSPARFASAIDKTHLEEQISLVDGVIFGAETLKAYGTSLPITNPQLLQNRFNKLQNPQPVHIVVSASGKIDPQLKFFEQSLPHWLLTTQAGSDIWQNKSCFERILMGQVNYSGFIWQPILANLTSLGIQKLAILGGGNLIASLLAVNSVDEIWLTICPIIFGGATAPTPVEGIGWLQSQGINLDLLEVKQIEQELFLHYRVKH